MLSERVESIQKSKAAEGFRIAYENPDIISLGTGEPDFSPPEKVIEIVNELLKKGYTHYSPPIGVKELREAVSVKLRDHNGIETEPDNIIITCGSTEAIMLSILTLVNPGDEVIFTDPGYHVLGPTVNIAGGIQKTIKISDENNFEINLDDLRATIGERTKLIYLNSPANPTGAILKRKMLEELADIVVDKNLMILSDEAYEKLIYDDNKHVSPASLNGMEKYVITTQTFSKTFAMSGLRVGYVTASREVIEGIAKLKICSTLCIPSAFQIAAIEALKNCWDYVEGMRKEYDRRRKMLLERLNKIPNIRALRPEGAFYIFSNIKATGMKSSEFVKKLLEEAKVLTFPGTEFGPNGEGYIRISYAAAYEKLQEAIDRIEKIV